MRLLTFTLLAALYCCSPAAAQSSEPAARGRAATAAMNDRRFDEAASIYRELLKTMPDEPGMLMNLGMALAMGGHEAEALAPLERAVALDPKLSPAHLFLGSTYLARAQPEKAIAPLTRVVALKPSDIEGRRMLAQALSLVGRTTDAIAQLRRITELAPRLPAGWHALGHAYNALTQDAMGTFDEQAADAPWRQLLLADALFADGRLTDAFALYRASLAELPSMISIHDSIAQIYTMTGHADWAAQERAMAPAAAAACARRKALCEFRAGRPGAALATALQGKDPESRYWRARASTELAVAAFKRLDDLPDSRERREVRATLARGQRRFPDAIAELEAALKLAPGDPGLLDDLGTTYDFARDFEKAVTTLSPLIKATPNDARLFTVYGDSLLQLERLDEALPVLVRAVELDPTAPVSNLTLGRAYLQKGEFAAAIPLIEPQLAQDQDGSLHVQLARVYSGLGQRDKSSALLERSQEIQRAAQARGAAAGQRMITAPK